MNLFLKGTIQPKQKKKRLFNRPHDMTSFDIDIKHLSPLHVISCNGTEDLYHTILTFFRSLIALGRNMLYFFGKE